MGGANCHEGALDVVIIMGTQVCLCVGTRATVSWPSLRLFTTCDRFLDTYPVPLLFRLWRPPFIHHSSSYSQLITAGGDGFVRTWRLSVVEGAEVTDEMPIFELEPLVETYLGEMPIFELEPLVETCLHQSKQGAGQIRFALVVPMLVQICRCLGTAYGASDADFLRAYGTRRR